MAWSLHWPFFLLFLHVTWDFLCASERFTSDPKALIGPKITMCGTTPLEGTTDSTFLTYLCQSCQTSCVKSIMGFYFYLPSHQSTNNLLLLLAQVRSFWAVSVHSCGANRGKPAIKSNPNETLHLWHLEGIWGAWASISEAAPGRIQPAWLSCSGWGLEVMGQNLNQEPEPPATLRMLTIVYRGTQGKWGKHFPHSSSLRLEYREIY